MTRPDAADRPDPNRYDAIVLGAGMTGLASADILVEQGAERVLILDEYVQLGGNHVDVEINGYTFDVGSLIFQDDAPIVARFPVLLEHYVEVEPKWTRLTPQRRVSDYPISIREDLISAGAVEILRIALSLAVARVRLRRQRNALEFAHYWLGPRMARRSGLERYIQRLCGLPAQFIDLEFARSRMGWIAEYARVGKVFGLLRTSRRSAPSRQTNRQLVRPRDGFAALYAPVGDALAAKGVEIRLGEQIASLRSDAEGVSVTTAAGVVSAPRLVSTIPIPHALHLFGEEAPELPTVTLVSLFFSFSGERRFGSSILYNFALDGTWKRLTMYSDFYGEHHGREYFTVEVVEHEGEPNVERSAAEFRAHTAANGLFDGELHLEGANVLSNAYPIFTAGSSARAAQGVARLRELGVESFGRQGGFQYQPTARSSVRTAERALGVPHRTVASDRERV